MIVPEDSPVTAPTTQGFWSYVHKDDEAYGGRISRLAHDIAAQYEMISAEPLALFLDIATLQWGDNWRQKIEANLASVAFFIPVLTPRYFTRLECRNELQFFASRATQLGLRQLILPLYYLDTPALREENPSDDLVKLTKTFQWEDWRELRFADTTSERYRQNVARLAARLLVANRDAEMATTKEAENVVEDIEADDGPGFLDRVAEGEEALPLLVERVTLLDRAVNVLGELATRSNLEVKRGDSQRKGYAARLLVAKRLAGDLGPVAEHIHSVANEIATQFHSVDDGYRAIIERASDAVAADPTSKEHICSFFSSVRGVSESAHSALQSIEEMITTFGSLESLARDLRPPLRRLREGLTTVVETRQISDAWIRLIDESGVHCSQTPQASP